MYAYEGWAEANLEIISRHDDEFLIQCLNPDHDDAHPSAYFNVDIGKWYCFACQARGSVADNPELSTIEIQSNVIKNRLDRILHPKEEEVCNYFNDAALSRYRIPTDYWHKRGFSADTQDFFELGYDAIADAVTIPVRNIESRLLGVTRRFLDPQHIGPRYKYPKGFKASQNLFASWLYEEYDMSTISIHEGAIDAMRLWQLGIPATALYGSNVSANHIALLLRMGVKKVVYFGDSDKAGQRAKERAKGFWVKPDGSYTYKASTDMSKDFLLFHVTDYNGHKDAGDMTDEEITKSWLSQKPYTFSPGKRPKKTYIDLRHRIKI